MKQHLEPNIQQDPGNTSEGHADIYQYHHQYPSTSLSGIDASVQHLEPLLDLHVSLGFVWAEVNTNAQQDEATTSFYPSKFISFTGDTQQLQW